jgi:hypothetical protein
MVYFIFLWSGGGYRFNHTISSIPLSSYFFKTWTGEETQNSIIKKTQEQKMTDIDTMDMACGIHCLDSLMDEFLEDSLNFTNLAQDDVVLGSHASFNVEEEVDAIIEASVSSKALHDRFETDIDAFLVESALDQQSEMNKGHCPENDSSAQDLETSLKKLHACMSQTARTRSWVTKNVPSFGTKKQLKNKASRMNIKCGKTRYSIQVKAKSGLSTGVSSFLHKKYLPNDTKTTLLDRHHFTSTLLSRNSKSRTSCVNRTLQREAFTILSSQSSKCCIADFLRVKKPNLRVC